MGASITLAPIMIISLLALDSLENDFLHQPVRLDGGKPDRSAGPGLRPRYVRLGGSFHRVCVSISVNHGAPYRRGANAGVVFCQLSILYYIGGDYYFVFELRQLRKRRKTVESYTWRDKAAFDSQAQKLAGMFSENFKTFADQASAEVRQAGPQPR